MNRIEKNKPQSYEEQGSTNRVFFNTAQRLQDTNTIKTKAAVMLIQATHFVQSKNLQKARELFIQIADICTEIKQPDQQVLKWIEISCSCLGILHKNSQQKRFKSSTTQEKRWRSRQNLLYLKYNKFTSQFQFDQYQQGFVSKDVLQYVSKINMILFGCQNVENSHSLYVMFSFYWIPLLLTLILLILTFVFFATHSLLGISVTIEQSQQFQIPAMIVAGVTILPIFMIFFKGLQQKDNIFFQKKLGEQIKKINQDCQKRKNNIFFMMPHGGQINIKIGSINQEEDIYNANNKQMEYGANQTPEDQYMNRIKGLTNQISKMSGASLSSFKY